MTRRSGEPQPAPSDRFTAEAGLNRTEISPVCEGRKSSAAIRFAFGGAYGATTMDNTGLVKIGARLYDPSTGRWTQADPTSYQTAIGTRPDVSSLSTSALFPSGVQNWKPAAPTCSLSTPQSLQYYTCANDDPVNNVDPSWLGQFRHCMKDVIGKGFGLTGAAATVDTGIGPFVGLAVMWRRWDVFVNSGCLDWFSSISILWSWAF